MSDEQTRIDWRKAIFTYEDSEGGPLYYFAPPTRTPGRLAQRHVQAIIDIAPDGTLAGVELIDNMPPLDAAPDAQPLGQCAHGDYSFASHGRYCPCLSVPRPRCHRGYARADAAYDRSGRGWLR